MLVFVYGTLQTGYRNNASVVRGRAASLGAATLAGARLVHYPAGFPGAYRAEDPGMLLHGELLQVPAEHAASVLRDMDMLEDYHGPGHPANLYSREEVLVTLPNGSTRQASIYFSLLNEAQERAVPVPSGDWRAFMQAQALEDVGEDWAAKPPPAPAPAAAGGQQREGGSPSK